MEIKKYSGANFVRICNHHFNQLVRSYLGSSSRSNRANDRYNDLFTRSIRLCVYNSMLYEERKNRNRSIQFRYVFPKLNSDPFPHLAIDPVDLPILILQLATHIDRHVSQITDHRVHLAHILLHLRFTGIVRDLGDITALRAKPVAIVHHPLGLVVHHLTVVVPFPRAFVLLEAGASVQRDRFISVCTNMYTRLESKDTLKTSKYSSIVCFKHFFVFLKCQSLKS